MCSGDPKTIIKIEIELNNLLKQKKHFSLQ